MSKDTWQFWIIPLGLWGLYSCWYMGFQAGFGDGYSSACAEPKSGSPFRQIAEIDKRPDPDEIADSAIR